MKNSIFLLLLLLFSDTIFAQNIAVKSFVKVANDMTARIDDKKLDQNGDVCAIIKVETTQTDFSWESDALGIVAAVPKVGEYWLYVPYGAKRLTIKHPKLGILRDYSYPLPIEKATVYVLTLVTGRVVTTVEETIESQWLVITPEPADAAVYIDEVFVKAGTYQTKLKAGSYTYRIEAPLYHTEAGKLEITDSKKELNVKLKPAFGYITVNTLPENDAKVMIDGKPLSQNSPSKSEALASGEHTLQVMKEMYQPTAQKVQVVDGQTTPITFTLQPTFAEINITAPTDAALYVNNQQKGNGNWSGRLNAGIYSLEARRDKHRTAKQDIELTAGDKRTIDLQPTPIYGSLDVITTPVGASISINGKEYGTTPNTIGKLLIGEYTVVLSKTGYGSVSKNVAVNEEGSGVVNVILLKGNDFLEKGMKKLNLIDYKGAIIDFTNAIKIEPLNAKAYCLRGSSKVGNGDYNGAISDCNKAIEINPEYSESYNIRGISKRAMKDSIGAVKDFNLVIKIIPITAEEYNSRGDAKYYLKNNIGAINDYTKTIEIDPRNTDAYIFRGDAKQVIGDLNDAILDYTKAIEIDPENLRAYQSRGIANFFIDNYINAIDNYTKAIEINPDDEFAYSQRGLAKYNIEDYKGAIIDFDKVLSINPMDSIAIKNRALAKNNILLNTVTDIDGNIYHTVKIGTQTWMVENLKVARYRNGDPIPKVANNETWAALVTGSWCDYDNLATNGNKYGHLYNWYAVSDSRKIAPLGWHVPTDAEWTTLTTYLSGEAIAGGKLKEVGTLKWHIPNKSATNETGFSALPSGDRGDGGTFFGLGDASLYWTASDANASDAWYRGVYKDYGNIGRSFSIKVLGFSLRCVKD